MILMGLCLLAGCGSPDVRPVESSPTINPADFALLPCAPEGSETRCALAIAGGKRILFGAPAGISHRLAKEELSRLDAVILFSLGADDLEGLDEVRNASWRAGREVPLLVAGPQGTIEMAAAINLAFEAADARRIVEEGVPPGGYDAAILVGRDADRDGGAVFDTGDVIVSGASDWAIGLPGAVSLKYGDSVELIFGECNSDQTIPDNVLRMGCTASRPDLVWPLTGPVFVLIKR